MVKAIESKLKVAGSTGLLNMMGAQPLSKMVDPCPPTPPTLQCLQRLERDGDLSAWPTDLTTQSCVTV